MRMIFIMMIPVISYLIPFDISSDPSMIKLCGNCEHVMMMKCKLFGKINIINGEIHYQSCISTRLNETQCGIKGKLYKRSIPFREIN